MQSNPVLSSVFSVRLLVECIRRSKRPLGVRPAGRNEAQSTNLHVRSLQSVS